MYKEFGVIFIILLAAIIIMWQLYQKKLSVYKTVTVSALILCIFINIIFNLRNVYPEFIYEGVPIGDSKENLFVYKSDSQFQWHILNRVAENRVILLNDEEEIYTNFFKLFAEECKLLEPDAAVKESILMHKEEFDETAELSMVKQLPYAFPEWESEDVPQLYLNTEGLKDCKTLIGIVDWNKDLYVMSETYYQAILRQEGNQ